MAESVDLFKKRSGTHVPQTGTTVTGIDDRFQLIAKLISTPETLDGAARAFGEFEEMIRKEFLRLTGEIGIPGESRLFNELLLLLSDLRDLVAFPHLANKNVLAIGGGFSSGKSRFINAVLGGDKLLPTGINPTTAIPTFLTFGDSEAIRALNTFNRSERLSRAEFKAISHAFNEDGTSAQSSVSFYHILKLVQVQTPAFGWKNIALLDTPGYSKPHTVGEAAVSGTDAGNTDEEKAREHLSQADHLIWAVPASSGTLHQDDIDFLKDKVQWDKPVYLLITKCDQSTDSDLLKQVAQIRDAFASNFRLAGWSAYSAKRKAVLDGDDPARWFDEVDGKVKFTQWRGRFEAVIDKVVRFNALEENRCSMLRESLRPVYLNADDGLTAGQIDAVKKATDEMTSERNAHASATRQFAAFRAKVEQRLDAILRGLGIADETAASVGLVATSTGPCDEKLLALKKGDRIDGTVDRLLPALGSCYIVSPSASGQMRIKYKDIEAHYSNPAQFFGDGKKVSLTVYEVDYGKKRVSLIATPAK